MSASVLKLSDVSAQDIVETVRDGLLVLDAELTVISANSAFYSMFATAAAGTIGHRLYDLGNGQWDIPALRVLLEEILPRETTVEAYEVEHIFPDVGPKTMLLNARKVHRPGSSVDFFLLTIDDVTELRNEQRKATINLRLGQTIADTVRDPLVILDSDMRIVTASRNFVLMFGDSAEVVVGQRLEDLKQGQWDVAALHSLLDHVVPDDRPFDDFLLEDEFPLLGHRIFKLYARKIQVPGNHGAQLLLVFEDATKEMLFDRHRNVLAAELAHRIKNSLQVISSFVAYELRQAADPCVEGYRAMQARIGAVAELYDVIAKSSAFGPVEVEAYLEGIASSIRSSLLGQHSKIEIAVEAEPLTIMADHAVPLGLMVNELATNAIKYAFPKGAGRITLGFQRRDGEVTLTVEDNGVGMNVNSSSGLGSRFLDAFAMQLGGTLAKASAETGTTFIVRLPMTVLAGNESSATLPA